MNTTRPPYIDQEINMCPENVFALYCFTPAKMIPHTYPIN